MDIHRDSMPSGVCPTNERKLVPYTKREENNGRK